MRDYDLMTHAVRNNFFVFEEPRLRDSAAAARRYARDDKLNNFCFGIRYVSLSAHPHIHVERWRNADPGDCLYLICKQCSIITSAFRLEASAWWSPRGIKTQA